MLKSLSCQKNANKARVYTQLCILYYEVASHSIRPDKYWYNKNYFTRHKDLLNECHKNFLIHHVQAIFHLKNY